MWTSILGMNPNCLYAEPGDWTRVAAVQGEAANHYTNDAGLLSEFVLDQGVLSAFYMKDFKC